MGSQDQTVEESGEHHLAARVSIGREAERKTFRVTELSHVCDRTALHDRHVVMAEFELRSSSGSHAIDCQNDAHNSLGGGSDRSVSISLNVSRASAVSSADLGLNPSPSFVARSLLTTELRSR